MPIFVHDYTNTDAVQTFAKIAHMPYSLLLDSADQTHADARYSYILTNPLETIEAKGTDITIGSRIKLLEIRSRNPFNVLKERLEALEFSDETLPNLPPFQGGAAGLFGYDLGRTLEEIPDTAIDNPDMPDMAVGIYDQVIAFDHKLDKAWIITHAKNELEAHMKQAVLLNNLAAPAPQSLPLSAPIEWQAQFKPSAFKARIDKVKKHILNGDIFQANLAQKFEAIMPKFHNKFDHYQKLRAINPAPFATYMNCGSCVISSSSPERFLHADNEGMITTKPIKGTAARHADTAKDNRAKDRLMNSEKDKAENVMITDLMRNDFSKNCMADSIKVTKLCALESFASVHHLVSTITGKLTAGKTAIDLLKGCFPGGSITGAPKIRAMEIIEDLEPQRRGAYCGSIGYIGFNGTMDSNILIRTIVYEDNQASFHVGGGITAMSDADAEYEETMDKASAIFDSFAEDEIDYKQAG